MSGAEASNWAGNNENIASSLCGRRGGIRLEGNRSRRSRGRIHQKTHSREVTVSAPARAQSGGLVSLGERSFRESEEGEQANLSLNRVLDLPLVPRHGARVI